MWHSAKLCVAQTSCVLLIVLCATTALLCDLNTYSSSDPLFQSDGLGNPLKQIRSAD
ncbi:hypothetical protein PF005_g24971 [Phytophthora fragariae]|uniref:Uncharacterized protein n=1 Tax=Phytophthora fragariae TaxID=53985 RepID=A0A6A3D7S7_9STRA|nr:hypothetical protein PF003_g21465 [Phytophthora fragariae]KAE8916223.1 hypothetical protein PF009_g33451 [Phytophthora fragariae]KAE8969961.1 hypothetical protein PF011_g26599 [Phytophthora fragariae]KAE9068099.1 hypothetical protein PF010_g27197 [Phytophthora fragariae]KAE9075529.1 hypothetical protein PF007_g24969 [Phytophthora fragariae]